MLEFGCGNGRCLLRVGVRGKLSRKGGGFAGIRFLGMLSG